MEESIPTYKYKKDKKMFIKRKIDQLKRKRRSFPSTGKLLLTKVPDYFIKVTASGFHLSRGV